MKSPGPRTKLTSLKSSRSPRTHARLLTLRIVDAPADSIYERHCREIFAEKHRQKPAREKGLVVLATTYKTLPNGRASAITSLSRAVQPGRSLSSRSSSHPSTP